MVVARDARILGWPALVLAPREVVVLTEEGAVLAIDKRGGEPRLVAHTEEGAIPMSAVHADGAIFMTTFGPDAPRGDILRVELGDGRIEVMARGEFRPSGIAVDGEQIYWTVHNTDAERVDGMVRSLPRNGGTPSTIARDQRGPWAIATRPGRVYWSNLPDYSGWTNGNLMSAHHDGSDARVIADGIGQAWHLARHACPLS